MSKGFKVLIIGLMALFLLGTKIWSQPPIPTLPIRLDVGSDHATQLPGNRLYQADQAWRPESPVGYVGGYRVWSSEIHPVDGTAAAALHQNQRHEWEEYRFSDIPNGDYLVTLVFSEIGVPDYAIFDVSIEGQVVLHNFRIAEEVGENYALTRRFTTTVRDGELNVAAKPVVGKSRLSAIEVDARSPDTDAPTAPVGIEATSSYNAVLLNWPDVAADDLDGYYVYRAREPDGPYTHLTDAPIHISRYRDPVPANRTRYFYRVSAVDVYGNESEPSPDQPGSAIGTGDAPLPLYALDISTENLERLQRDPLSDDEVIGTFIYGGQRFPVEVRYRGGYGRLIHKKSWKIKFVENSPFPGQNEINLRADYADRSLMHSKLAQTLFKDAGIQSLETQHVLLLLNGVYQGVYTAVEHMDESFLHRAGYHPHTSIYKVVHTETNDWSAMQPSKQAYRQAYEKKTNRGLDHEDVIALIELINETPNEIFAPELTRVFDVKTYLDYYAVIVLTGNRDFVQHNVYLLHDLDADWWTVVPYDLDGAFEPVWEAPVIPYETPIDRGTATSPVEPWGFSSVLLTRMLDVPQFRAYYCHRLAEFMDTIFSDAAMAQLIDTTFAEIKQDGRRDWHKRYREDNAWFIASPSELKAYVSARKKYLWEEIATYCPVEQPYLAINEVMVGDLATERSATDGLGTPWLEIHNLGLEPVDLEEMYLVQATTLFSNAASLPTRLSRLEIPDGVQVAAGGFITQNFDLRADGELAGHTGRWLMLFQEDEQIDAFEVNGSEETASWGRYPDGVDRWRSFNVPTPGATNVLEAPIISGTRHIPLIPAASEAVTVVSEISGDGVILTATLHYSTTDGSSIVVSMDRLWEGLYMARIPPQPEAQQVQYRVVAEDDDGQVSTVAQSYIVGYEPPNLFINEVIADNETTLADAKDPGEFPDWIEIYNPGPEDIDLGGRYLTDDLNDPVRFRIAQGITVPARGFLVFYADNDPEQGPLHTNFRLSRWGETVGLFDIDAVGNQPLDVYTFGPLEADVSEGRCPDGGEERRPFAHPTPGGANELCGACPVIGSVERVPQLPTARDQVTVSAIISYTDQVTVTLWYSASAGHTSMGEFLSLPMRPDVEGGKAVWRTVLPAQPEDVTVAYYVAVKRGDNGHPKSENETEETRSPTRAPYSVYVYRVGYMPPPLFVNEVMADNETTLEDPEEPGEFPDWIELYNAGFEPVDLGGKYLTDDLAYPDKFRITDGTQIPARGVLLFYADGDPEQGPLHTNFRLSRSGEVIGLFDSDKNGRVLIDARTFGRQFPDVSERRYPAGGGLWISSRAPTPGQADFPLGSWPYLPLVFRRY